MKWLLDLPLRRIGMTQRLAEEMSRFIERGLTGYDSAYAALASLNRGRWLTFDAKATALLGNQSWIAAP